MNIVPMKKIEDSSLEAILANLEKYGLPRLSKHDTGWHCGVDVFVLGEGTTFKVRSDFDHNTHTEAARLCYTRMAAELKRIKDTT